MSKISYIGFTCTPNQVRLTVRKDGAMVIIVWTLSPDGDWLIDKGDYAAAGWLGEDLEAIIAAGPNVWCLAEMMQGGQAS